MPNGEEALKLQSLGVAHARSRAAFRPSASANGSSGVSLHGLVHQDVYQPSTEEALRATSFIRNAASEGRIKVLIPMRELEADIAPVIDRTIRSLGKYVGTENVFISDGGLHPEIKKTIIDTRANLIPVAEVKSCFDLPGLLDILALDRLDFGLGMSIFFGMAYFALERIARPDDWVVKLDGDIVNFEDCLLLHYLLYPLCKDPGLRWDYLKIAKVGRNNEAVLAAINGLAAWFSDGVARKGGEASARAVVAREIYESCIRQVWLLSGQYAIRWQRARGQLATTGYCDPLVVSIQNGWRNFAQTINPHPLLDMANTKRKEDCMMTRTVQFLNALVVFQQSLRREWSIEEVARFNREVARHLEHVVWIPDEMGPLRVDSLEADRMFPAIENLLSAGLLR